MNSDKRFIRYWHEKQCRPKKPQYDTQFEAKIVTAIAATFPDRALKPTKWFREQYGSYNHTETETSRVVNGERKVNVPGQAKKK